jgi:arsenite methyltransferase
VLFTDISRPLLRHVEAAADRLGVRGQCSFHHCSAETLTAIGDMSVDVVTTRAVLAYVGNKSAALREFHRILKPGGRLSIAEPILRDEAIAVSALKLQLDARPAEQSEPLIPLLHRWKAAQFQTPLRKSPMARSPTIPSAISFVSFRKRLRRNPHGIPYRCIASRQHIMGHIYQ